MSEEIFLAIILTLHTLYIRGQCSLKRNDPFLCIHTMSAHMEGVDCDRPPEYTLVYT